MSAHAFGAAAKHWMCLMWRLAVALLVLVVILPSAAQDKKKPGPGMDYGPFLSCAVLSKPGAKFDNNTGHFEGDVTARGLANWYAQQLGTSFTESMKPYEVEIVVAEVGAVGSLYKPRTIKLIRFAALTPVNWVTSTLAMRTQYRQSRSTKPISHLKWSR